MNLPIILTVIILLVAANGFYVAAELATVSAKRPRLAQLADEGVGRARQLLSILTEPARLTTFIAATQIGITIASLTLGFWGQTRLVAWLEPQMAHLPGPLQWMLKSLLALLVLLGLTTFQVLLGELIPKNLGLQHPERVALFTLPLMQWSMTLFRPLIVLVDQSTRRLLRLFGVADIPAHATVHSPEEIRLLVEESSAGGVLDREERRLLVNTLHLRQVIARKVMIPRNRILAAPVTLPVQEIFTLLARSPYSRLPLYEESIDQIIGVVHLKDLLQLDYHQRQRAETAPSAELDVRQFMRKPLLIPDSLLIDDVIAQLQRTRNNVAIVVDEYGGTAGMVALEDLIEEIIGEFQDEFDADNPAFRLRSDQQLLVRGDVQLDYLREHLALNLTSEAVDTVGGLVASTLGRIPGVGDLLEIAGVTLRVERMEQNRVAEVSLTLPADHVDRLARWRDD